VAVKNAFRQAFFLLILAAIPATCAALFHPKRPAWSAPPLAPSEILLQTALDESANILWIDARSATDYQKSHIPGALLLNEDDWDNLLPQALAAWRTGKIVVVYCSSSQCHTSEAVAQRLREEARLPDVRVLKGGWESWQTAHEK
jgi:rhodanese-related sulfurtransferase